MPDKPFPIGRIELPEDWEPEGVICARVPIPDDPQYFSMLVGLVDQLRNSALFDRDPTRSGAATVSRTWENALNSMPIIIINCEGDEMPTILRDDPSDPCKVQQSTDGGGTWTHAFNKGCDDLDGIPTPNEPAAEGAGNFMFNLYLHIAQMLDAAADEAEFAGDLCDWFDLVGITLDPTWYADCNELASGLKFAWDNLTGPQKAEMLDPCTYAPMFEELQSCFDDAGVMEWLNCAHQTLGEWLHNAHNNLMEELNQAARAITGTSPENAAGFGGGGGGAGFGDACAGEFECPEFAETSGGFLKKGSYGVWTSGLGWKAQITPSNSWEVRIIKTSGFAGGTPSNIQVGYVVTGNAKLCELFVNGVSVVQQIGGPAGGRQLNYTPTGAVTSIEIFLSQNNLNSLAYISSFCITA